MSKRTPQLLIDDMLDSCNKILQYTEGMTFEDFTKDSKTIDAVIRNFEIMAKLPIDCLKNLKINILQLTGIEFAGLEIG